MSGGVLTVQRAGPWLPAEATHTTPYLSTTSLIISPNRLQNNRTSFLLLRYYFNFQMWLSTLLSVFSSCGNLSLEVQRHEGSGEVQFILTYFVKFKEFV